MTATTTPHSAWVDQDGGRLVRIDPESGDNTQDFDLE